MFLPPVVPGVPPGPQHHPTLPAGRGVTPRAPRHLCRHRNVVQSSNLSHHTHFGASLPLTSTPTVSCTTGASHQNLHVSDRRINVLIVARLPNRLPEGRLTKGVVQWDYRTFPWLARCIWSVSREAIKLFAIITLQPIWHFQSIFVKSSFNWRTMNEIEMKTLSKVQQGRLKESF